MTSLYWRDLPELSNPYAEVIGDPIAQSKSPDIHGFWLGTLGISAEYRRAHVPPGELDAYFAHRRNDPRWRGCNITMPHKMSALSFADDSDRSAANAKAANVMVAAGDGKLHAYNSDIEGVAEPLRHTRIAPYPGRVAVYAQIVGAGGAARAAVLGIREAKAASDVDIFVRDPQKAQPFAAWANTPSGRAQPIADLGPVGGVGDAEQRHSHILINATSLGMAGNPPLAVDLSRYHSDTIIFDMVYDPLETPLLRQARQCGFRTIDGLDMLVAQAARGFSLFFGVEAPREHDAELRKLLTR